MKGKRKSSETFMNDQSEEEDFRSLLEHGTGLLRQGYLRDGMQLLEQAHALRPQDLDAALNLAGAYILNKRFSKAVPLLEALSEREPKNPNVWTNLGAAYLGNPILSDEPMQRRAIRAFKRALALDPDAPGVAYNIGLIYYRYLEDRPKAIEWMRRALKTNPEDWDARLVLNRLLVEEE